ncbi:MAG TPA: arylsulfatase [Oligoflexus sp.]|uniref:arylsulfatase n=1 Tax=Oligoflexus sp. TaxID=1971216 RepID=UPI002D730670|nr:arylsulfatase [Oligoflexus sp.]HYX37597.1 arylsulfatase [Oligoflexus sp.]
MSLHRHYPSQISLGVMATCLTLAPVAIAAANPNTPDQSKPEKAPNILIFLLDDVGFGQLGPFGSLIQTPNIDRVAKNGLRYTNFHTTALCSPSRAALLTGRNHHSVGTGVIEELQTDFPGYTGRIPKEKALFVETLKNNGYNTAGFGKWHNTPVNEVGKHGPYDLWPIGQGFERWYGFLAGETSQWEPTLWDDKTPVEPHTKDPKYHFTQDMTDQALKWLEQQKAGNPGKPFFMYFAPGAAHAPHHAPKEYIDKYAGKFDQGWDIAREQILARQKLMGIVPGDTALSPRTEVIPAWDTLADSEKKLYAHMQEVFAGMVEHTDAQFGRILDQLEKSGELDNTLILITSDNGASGEGSLVGSFNEIRVFNGIPDSLEENLAHMNELGSINAFNHYPAGWALAGNTPFRYFKQSANEGGVRDPLIVSWPRKISDKGSIRPQFAHMIDVASTIYDITGIPVPKIVNGIEQKPLEGVTFAPSLFNGQAKTNKKIQYFEMLGNRGIWVDGWKAVTFHGRLPWDTGSSNPNFDADIWQLYHLDEDYSETHDLAQKYPEKLAEMKQLWVEEATKHNVFPLDDTTASRVAATYASFTKGIKEFSYTQDEYRVSEPVSPPVKNRPHSIVAMVDIPEAGADGVLVTCGGRFAGYSFFIKDGMLNYIHNYMGESIYRMTSSEKVPSGRSELKFVFTKTGKDSGRGEIFINGKSVAQGDISKVVPAMYSASETFDVGRDTGSPISNDYQVPFTFSGKIEKLNVSLLD